MSSPKGNQMQAPNDWRDSVNILDNYARYSDAFMHMLKWFKSIWDGHLGHIATATHRFELDPPVSTSIYFVPYRARPITSDFEKIEIDNMFGWMLLNQLISNGPSLFCSSPRIAKLTDLRELLSAQCLYSTGFSPFAEGVWIWSLPGDVNVLSTVDGNRTYWQMEVDIADCKENAFTTHHSSYQFFTILSCLKNASITVQRAMCIIFQR